MMTVDVTHKAVAKPKALRTRLPVLLVPAHSTVTPEPFRLIDPLWAQKTTVVPAVSDGSV